MTGSRLSWQVRLAAALVGLGSVIGVGMVALAFWLTRIDPDFLFAVLPIIFLFLAGAGVLIAISSWALVVRLRRAAPGVRMEVALLGGSLVACGFFVAAGSSAAAVVLILYGGTLAWLITTPAAAHDLGAWMAPLPKRGWFRRGTGPPWWETWQAGLAQGMPLWELLVVAAALVAFAVGLLSFPLGLALFPALRPLPFLLIPLAVAVVWLVEQRMKARLTRE